MLEKSTRGDEKEKVQFLMDHLKDAGSVCHEMKQPLMITMGFLDLLLIESSDLPETCERLNKIKFQINRLSELTNTLMGLTRK